MIEGCEGRYPARVRPFLVHGAIGAGVSDAWLLRGERGARAWPPPPPSPPPTPSQLDSAIWSLCSGGCQCPHQLPHMVGARGGARSQGPPPGPGPAWGLRDRHGGRRGRGPGAGRRWAGAGAGSGQRAASPQLGLRSEWLCLICLLGRHVSPSVFPLFGFETLAGISSAVLNSGGES